MTPPDKKALMPSYLSSRCLVWRSLVVLATLWLAAAAQAAPAPPWIAWDPAAVPASVEVEGAYIGMHEGVVLVVGGATANDRGDRAASDRILALVREADGWRWREAGRLPRPMAFGAAVTTPRGLLCLGGERDGEPFDDAVLVRWDAARGEAEVIEWPALPRPTARAAGARLGATVYVAGGLVGGAPSTQFLAMPWDLLAPASQRATWRELPAWSGRGRSGALLVAQGAAETNCLFLLGGADRTEGGATHSEALRYEPATESWREIASPPRRLQGAAAAPIGVAHLLVAVPAEAAAGSVDFLAYHTITDTWTAAPVAAPSASSLRPLALITSGGPQHLIADTADGLVAIGGSLTSAGSHFLPLDYATLAAYLLLIVAIGLWFTNRGGTTNDFFLAGNRIPWWAAGISLLATQVSSIGFMAIPAKTFATNWAYFLGVATWFIVVPIVTRWYIPYFRRFHVTSAYEYLELRFNLATRLFAAISFSLMQIGRLAIVLLLPALALATVTDLDLVASILLMGAVATLYTVTGGMAAVVWTDVVQAGLLMAGAVVAIVVVISSLDGGVAEFARVAAADDKMRLVLPTMDIGAAAVWVVLVGNVFSRLSGLISDQAVVQRYLTTPDAGSAKRALWLDVATSIPWAVIVFLLGTALYVFYKAHPAMLHPAVDTNGVVPLFIAHAFPPGLTGLLLAAIFAAAMSSLDSSMHATSTVVVTDFFIRFRPGSSERGRVWLAKSVVVLLGVFGTVTAIYLATSDMKSIWDQSIAIIGLFVGVLAGLFIVGVFTARTDGWDALLGAIAGAAVTFYVSRYTRISFFLYPAVSIVTCVAMAWLLSFIPRPRRDAIELTAFHRPDGSPEPPPRAPALSEAGA